MLGQGVPEPLARAHALRPELRYAPDMVWVAGATGRPIEEVADVFFAVGAELRLDWIEGELERVPAPTRTQRWALAGRPRGRRPGPPRARRMRARREPGGPPPKPSRRSSPSAARRYRRLTAFLRSLAREGEPDLAGLTLAVRQLRTIVASPVFRTW